jgi:hypothetical protein
VAVLTDFVQNDAGGTAKFVVFEEGENCFGCFEVSADDVVKFAAAGADDLVVLAADRAQISQPADDSSEALLHDQPIHAVHLALFFRFVELFPELVVDLPQLIPQVIPLFAEGAHLFLPLSDHSVGNSQRFADFLLYIQVLSQFLFVLTQFLFQFAFACFHFSEIFLDGLQLVMDGVGLQVVLGDGNFAVFDLLLEVRFVVLAELGLHFIQFIHFLFQNFLCFGHALPDILAMGYNFLHLLVALDYLSLKFDQIFTLELNLLVDVLVVNVHFGQNFLVLIHLILNLLYFDSFLLHLSQSLRLFS